MGNEIKEIKGIIWFIPEMELGRQFFFFEDNRIRSGIIAECSVTITTWLDGDDNKGGWCNALWRRLYMGKSSNTRHEKPCYWAKFEHTIERKRISYGVLGPVIDYARYSTQCYWSKEKLMASLV